MKILAIESSCDDTSVALVDCSAKGFFVIEEKTASQINLHKKYGGVIPEIAGRLHAEKILPIIEEVLKNKKFDAIAVTSGPGLITGLIVGVETAKNLSYLLKKPIISVNHLEGHIQSVELGLKTIQYPALALVVSGGHTELVLIKKPGVYKLVGVTLDDAAGECFDKVAKMLNLTYPGGPKISAFAQKGNRKAVALPRPMLNQNNFDFSFSGLKTAALYHLQKNPIKKEKELNDFCASLEESIVEVLTEKTIRAGLKYKTKSIILSGGVSANKYLREILSTKTKEKLGLELMIPELKYCMDNAVMIAIAGYYKAKNKKYTDWKKIKANPNWEIG